MRIGRLYRTTLVALLLAATPLGPSLRASPTTTPAASEFSTRRAALMERLPNGIVLLHARSAAKTEDQPGFLQDASFYYFTGLDVQPGAILVVDGPRREARLFVPPAPMSFGQPVPGLGPEMNAAAAAALEVTTVESWAGFATWLRQRLAQSPATLYVDAPRRPEETGSPAGLWPVAGDKTLWRAALGQAFPEASIESALEVLRAMRWVKSASEVDALRDNARATVLALGAAAGRIGPGVSQRQVEATVISACMEAGAQGPSFWPWTMSGPNAHIQNLVRAFYSYEHLDREMLGGEVVRVDIGCRGHGYGADVGRTIPVDGKFTAVQAEVWNLLIGGYLAGLDAMRDGIEVSAVRAASRDWVRQQVATLQSTEAKRAAEILDEDAAWHLHGVGIESGEEGLPILRAGTVLAYEPMVAVGADAFYLEDMVLVTSTGHEVLSAGLPYTAEQIAAFTSASNR